MKPIKHKYITKFHIGQRLSKLSIPLIAGGVIEIIDILPNFTGPMIIRYRYVSSPDHMDIGLECERDLPNFSTGVLDETYTPS